MNKLPKFYVTTTLVSLLMWITIALVIHRVPPASITIVLLVMLILVIAASLTITNVLFLVAYKNIDEKNQRSKYRKILKTSLKWTSFLGVFIIAKILITS